MVLFPYGSKPRNDLKYIMPACPFLQLTVPLNVTRNVAKTRQFGCRKYKQSAYEHMVSADSK